MIGFRPLSLLFIFSLCFGSFFAGWMAAVYILPGNLLEQKANQKKQEISAVLPSDLSLREGEDSIREEKGRIAVPSLKEVMDSLLILFDPYKMDAFIKNNTHLNKKDSYIKNEPVQIPLKAPLLSSPALNSQDNASRYFEKGSLPDKTESPPSPLPSNQEDHLAGLQKKYDKQNRRQLNNIQGQQDFFSAEGKFSFFVNAFSDQKEAEKYVQDLKKKYPLWSFLIKAHANHISIYLGPFSSKEQALSFKNALLKDGPFAAAFIEEVSL